jgi:hypothetical protein
MGGEGEWAHERRGAFGGKYSDYFYLALNLPPKFVVYIFPPIFCFVSDSWMAFYIPPVNIWEPSHWYNYCQNCYV